ncbi:MAG: sigma-70 family RNA polymerase sigma factor [Planctomycetes bacterium]|nr:sigma-70 family RNA polymerase sigma factor [Planctomycetota bacterium]
MSFSDLDPDLVAAAIRGEREAVTALTQAYLPRVFGLALRLTRNREQAEEVTQETFVRALRNLTQLKNPARLTSWLLTITANTVRELARKQRREAPLDYEPPAIEPEVDGSLERRQKALDLAVAQLEPHDRELFLLHTVEGVRLKALASEHGVSLPAMKSRVHRIRSRIRVSVLDELEAVGAGA